MGWFDAYVSMSMSLMAKTKVVKMGLVLNSNSACCPFRTGRQSSCPGCGSKALALPRPDRGSAHPDLRCPSSEQTYGGYCTEDRDRMEILDWGGRKGPI